MQYLKHFIYYTLGILAIIATALVCLNIGRYELSLSQIYQVLAGSSDDTQRHILLSFRLPRIVVAIIVGAGLSVAGAAFQSLFRNPLATPDILGVTSAASFGAVLGLMLGLSISYISIVGFIFGLLSLFLVILVGYNKHLPYQTATMILSGIIISSLFQSLIGIVKYLADPQDTLPTITYWLLGSLDVVLEPYVVYAMLGVILGSAVIFIVRWKCNVLMLQDDEAKSLGVNLALLRAIVILSSTLIIACAVSVCGVIGWVGLLVPHIARLIIGHNYARIIPLSILIGAIFLMLVDTLSRSISSEQIPISILTSLLGAPFFIYILRKSKTR